MKLRNGVSIIYPMPFKQKQKCRMNMNCIYWEWASERGFILIGLLPIIWYVRVVCNKSEVITREALVSPTLPPTYTTTYNFVKMVVNVE